MSLQKKTFFGIRDNSLRSRTVRSTGSLKYYGPPPIEHPALSSEIGYRLKRRPAGLKKKVKQVEFGVLRGDQSYPLMSTKLGETNLLQRLGQLDYFSAWTSKISVYNLCQEKFIGKLQNSTCKQNRNMNQL